MWILVSLIGLLELSSIHTESDFYREAYPNLSDEKLLCATLMDNYTRIGLNGRPIQNRSEAIQVEFGLGLIQMDLDERDKILVTSMWSKYRWHDHYLRWNPEDFGGIQTIKVAANQVWKPDIMLYNTAETDVAERQVLAVISYNGWVMWVPHQIFKSSCSIDVTNFPFDQQNCSMWFGSWTYSLNELNLTLAFSQGIDLSTFMNDYKESCSWDISNHSAVRQLMPAENPSFVLLGFTLYLERKMVFSTYILTLPCIFLASLTLVVFWLPPDRPDRTSLAMSVFSSFLLLLLILVEAAPPTASSVPTLGVYYCFNMVIIMLSVFLSTLVVNVCRCGEKKGPVPLCVRKVMIDVFGCFFCLVPHQKASSPNTKTHMEQEASQNLLKEATDSHAFRDATLQQSYPNNRNNHGFIDPNKSQSFMDQDSPRYVEKELLKMRVSIQDMASAMIDNLISDQRRKQVQGDWKTVALVMDRMFFIIYLLAITFSLIFLFPRPL